MCKIWQNDGQNIFSLIAYLASASMKIADKYIACTMSICRQWISQMTYMTRNARLDHREKTSQLVRTRTKTGLRLSHTMQLNGRHNSSRRNEGDCGWIGRKLQGSGCSGLDGMKQQQVENHDEWHSLSICRQWISQNKSDDPDSQ